MHKDHEHRKQYQKAYWKARYAIDDSARKAQRARCRRYYKKHAKRLRERNRAYYAANREKMREKNRTQRLKHREKRLVSARAKAAQTKIEAFAAYGGPKCYCCGETLLLFLALDHINGDGYIHRKVIKRQGSAIYFWLKRQGFPPGYRVACHNCNHGTYLNGGICPHKGVTGKILVKRKRLS